MTQVLKSMVWVYKLSLWKVEIGRRTGFEVSMGSIASFSINEGSES